MRVKCCWWSPGWHLGAVWAMKKNTVRSWIMTLFLNKKNKGFSCATWGYQWIFFNGIFFMGTHTWSSWSLGYLLAKSCGFSMGISRSAWGIPSWDFHGIVFPRLLPTVTCIAMCILTKYSVRKNGTKDNPSDMKCKWKQMWNQMFTIQNT